MQTPQYIDAHIHLDHYRDDELPALYAELEHLRMIALAVATNPQSYAKTLDLAAKSPWIRTSFGIHPWQAVQYADQLEQYDELIANSATIGEVGLDTVWAEDPIGSLPAQRKVLRYFLQAAREQNKVLNLHTKGAEAEILALLDEYRIERAIIHWYSGPLDIAEQLIARGYHFTIGVELHSSPLVQALAQRIPMAQLLTETDNPTGVEWLDNERGFARHLLPVVDRLAELRGVEREALREGIVQNSRQLGLF